MGKRGHRTVMKRLAIAGSVVGLAATTVGGTGTLGVGGTSSDAFAQRTVTMVDPGTATDTTVSVGNAAIGRRVPNGFVGVSLEYNGVEPYTGSNPRAVNPLFVRLLDGLASHGDLIVRIGGDSGDLTWYPAPGIKRPAALWYTLNKNWFEVTKALADESGAKFILDLNLLARDNKLAAAEARALLAGVGRRHIKAFEIGNEPEFYSSKAWNHDHNGRRPGARADGFSPTEFAKEAATLAKSLPRVPVADPATGSLRWLKGSATVIDTVPRLKEFTFHRYPLNACVTNPSDPAYASVEHLLGSRANDELPQGVARFVRLAHQHRMSFRVDELNSVTCGGREGVSNSFASALWLTGTLLEMVNSGADGVNIHIHPEAVAGQLFTFNHDHGTWTASVNPAYYGVTLFNRAAPAGSRLLRTNVAGGGHDVRAWATQTPGGRRNVVAINESLVNDHTVLIRVPASAKSCTLQGLTAPNAFDTTGVTLDGQSFGADARLHGSKSTTTIPVRNGGCRFTLPASTAAQVGV